MEGGGCGGGGVVEGGCRGDVEGDLRGGIEGEEVGRRRRFWRKKGVVGGKCCE